MSPLSNANYTAFDKFCNCGNSGVCPWVNLSTVNDLFSSEPSWYYYDTCCKFPYTSTKENPRCSISIANSYADISNDLRINQMLTLICACFVLIPLLQLRRIWGRRGLTFEVQTVSNVIMAASCFFAVLASLDIYGYAGTLSSMFYYQVASLPMNLMFCSMLYVIYFLVQQSIPFGTVPTSWSVFLKASLFLWVGPINQLAAFDGYLSSLEMRSKYAKEAIYARLAMTILCFTYIIGACIVMPMSVYSIQRLLMAASSGSKSGSGNKHGKAITRLKRIMVAVEVFALLFTIMFHLSQIPGLVKSLGADVPEEYELLIKKGEVGFTSLFFVVPGTIITYGVTARVQYGARGRWKRPKKNTKKFKQHSLRTSSKVASSAVHSAKTSSNDTISSASTGASRVAESEMGSVESTSSS